MFSPSLKESVVRGALWVGIDRWLNQILSLSIYVVLARLVGPTSFGLVALAGVYIAFVRVFVRQGFGAALVQRKEVDGRHLDSAFWVNLLMATTLALGSIALSGQLAILFGEPQLAEVLRWLSGVLVLSSLSTIPEAVLARSMSFQSLTMSSLLATITGGGVGLLMAWGGLGVWSLVGQQLTSALVGTAVLWRATSWRPSFHLSRSHLRDLYGFSMSVVGNEILWFGTQRMDQALIGFVSGASALGPYAMAARILNLSRDLLIGPLEAVSLSAFSKLQDERERLRNAFYDMTEVVAAVAIPAFCGIAALAGSFVPAIFGEAWSPAVPILQILALYGLAWIPLSFGHGLMLAIGRPGVFAMLNLIQTCLTLGFCLLAIKWGPVGVAGAVFLAMVVYSVVFLAVCRKLVGISFRVLMSRLWAPTLAAAVMASVVSVLQSSISESLGASMTTIAGILLGASIYWAGMALLRPKLLKQLRQDLLLRVTRLAA